MKKFFVLVATAAFVLGIFGVAFAVPAAPIYDYVEQPDGTKFTVGTMGDEWSNWTVTEDGYAILKSGKSGYWVYAQPSANGKALDESELRVGIDKPLGIQPGLAPTLSADTLRARAMGQVASKTPIVSGSGIHKLLVILVNFSNRTLTTTEADWAGRFFGATSSVKDYYDEASYGNLNILPAEESYGAVNDGIVVVNVGYNHINTGGTSGDTDKLLVKNALIAADSFVNYASFDANASAALATNELHIVIVAAGYETSYGGSSACSPNIWAHRWSLSGTVAPPVLDGVTVADWYSSGGYTRFGELHSTTTFCGSGAPYMATIGVMAHELGHDLWLPDAYDTDGTSEGIGSWGIMGSGSWNYIARPGDSPAHPTAWDKWYEGWLTPILVSGSSTVSIPQVETSATVYQLLSNPSGVDWRFYYNSGVGEYFLVENRQQIGYDAGLPSCGILIWHINEAAPNSNSANSNEWGTRLVALEQRDGLFNLEYRNNRGDAGDPYMLGNTFNDATTPNSWVGGSASGVNVTVNGNCGATTSVTFGTAVPPPTDDHGDTWDTATPVATPSTTNGNIEVIGDVDYFSFNAVAGINYIIYTDLFTLLDTVLYLYDTDGTTAITYNDDIDGPNGNYASSISWACPATGTYYAEANAYAFAGLTGTYTVSIIVDANPPLTYYQDADNDSYGNPNVSQSATSQPPGYVLDNTDCNDNNPAINPGVAEIPDDNIDNNCDGLLANTYYYDGDNDGYGNQYISQIATSQPTGYVLNNTDCNDNNGSVYPGATEICGDGIDQNCNGSDLACVATNTYYRDYDGDGYGNGLVPIKAPSQPVGYVANYRDCNDNNPAINPSATELCDGWDNDCDGAVDEGCRTYYRDNDSDGYGISNNRIKATTRPAGYAPYANDCDDNNRFIYPNARELCDGIDNNCNTRVDEGCP